MKATEVNFLQFLQGDKQFIIPIYQRTYSWPINACQQLWDDILRVAQDEQIPAHFLGSIVYVGKGIFQVAAVPELLVIDGQQRLATLFLLLTALGEKFKEQGKVIEQHKIHNSYLFNQYESDEKRYRLQLTRSDKNTLNAILDGSEEPNHSSPRIKENYQFFKNQINQSEITSSALLDGIRKLVIVDISLAQQDNPQLIFESLNSTGMDLSQADLIRNYVLMGLDNKEQEKLYKNYWYPMEQSFGQTQNVVLFNRFMRDYLTLKTATGEIPNMDKVYATFKIYHQNKSSRPMEEIVSDIYQYSKYFTRMVLAREKDPALKRCFDDLKKLEMNVIYPFLLEVYDDYEQKKLDHYDFIAILRLIESYIFRRQICGISSRSMNTIFATLIKEIDKEHYLESVQAAFLLKSGGARFPRDEDFRKELLVKDIYNAPRIRHYLLSKLENNWRKEVVNIDECTIEHILPQNPNLSREWQKELGADWQHIQKTYLHTIGNLTLTAYNSAMSDRPFHEKRDLAKIGLAFSPLHLNEGLGQVQHWNAEEIERRAQRLADRALKIWTLPVLASEQLGKYGRRVESAPLTEAIGPVEHPLAGFVPAGYKISQTSEKRYQYCRLIEGEWVPYGNGKIAWYATSWSNAGKYIRDHARKDEKPLGVGGELNPLYSKAMNGDASEPDHDSDDANGKAAFTLESYPHLQGAMASLFEHLRKRILNLDLSIKEEYKKLYIAYKLTTNFVDIEPHKSHLLLFLNMPFSEIDDPMNLCRDISSIGHHGNGDIDIRLSSIDQLDDVMELVRQAFEWHWEEGAV